MAGLLRERLTRLDITATVLGLAALTALLVGGAAYYIGFSAAEDAQALPHPLGVLEWVCVAFAALCALGASTAVVAGARLQRAARRQRTSSATGTTRA